MKIESLHNEKVKKWMRLKEKKGREQAKKFLVEGAHLVEEAYQAGCLECVLTIEDMQMCAKYQKPQYLLEKKVFQKLQSVNSQVNQIGVCTMPEYKALSGKRFIVLDSVQDPGNVGTIIRSAYAFGFDAVFVSNTSVDFYNEKVIRASQGAIFHIPCYRMDLASLYDDFKEQQIYIYATMLAEEAVPLQKMQLNERFALVFGNEGSGIGVVSKQVADQKIKIEMQAFESLNVAVAAGICMHFVNIKEV